MSEHTNALDASIGDDDHLNVAVGLADVLQRLRVVLVLRVGARLLWR